MTSSDRPVITKPCATCDQRTLHRRDVVVKKGADTTVRIVHQCDECGATTTKRQATFTDE